MFGFQKVDSVTTDALKLQLHKRNTLVLDVREPTEYRAGHLANARNVPLRQIDAYNPPANKQVYVICQSGARSRRAYKRLRKRGIQAINVTGGMLAWKGSVR